MDSNFSFTNSTIESELFNVTAAQDPLAPNPAQEPDYTKYLVVQVILVVLLIACIIAYLAKSGNLPCQGMSRAPSPVFSTPSHSYRNLQELASPDYGPVSLTPPHQNGHWADDGDQWDDGNNGQAIPTSSEGSDDGADFPGESSPHYQQSLSNDDERLSSHNTSVLFSGSSNDTLDGVTEVNASGHQYPLLSTDVVRRVLGCRGYSQVGPPPYNRTMKPQSSDASNIDDVQEQSQSLDCGVEKIVQKTDDSKFDIHETSNYVIGNGVTNRSDESAATSNGDAIFSTSDKPLSLKKLQRNSEVDKSTPEQEPSRASDNHLGYGNMRASSHGSDGMHAYHF